MLYSMTAFARNESHGDYGSLVWEIKSVNHRFLEVNIHMPEGFNLLESQVREHLKRVLQRGKIDVSLRWQANPQVNNQWAINTLLLKQLSQAVHDLKNQVNIEMITAINPLEILRWPGMIQLSENQPPLAEQNIMQGFEEGLTDLLAMREREGAALQQLLQQRLEALEKEVAKVVERRPQLMKTQRERLLTRFAEAKINLEPERLEHEMVLFAHKIDASEELDRLQTHIQEFKRVLREGGALGRRLDFLTQELHRETNTLSAKANDSITTQSAVELKVIIEQIREQVQNIE